MSAYRLGGTFGNALAEAATILEINQKIREVERNVVNWSATMIRDLGIWENAVATLIQVDGERKKIEISCNKLKGFANNAYERMGKIRETKAATLAWRNAIDGVDIDDEERQQLRDEIHQIDNARDAVFATIGNVEQAIESLKVQFRNLTTCTLQQKAANAKYRAVLKQTHEEFVNRNRKSLARYEELVKKYNRMRDDVKVEKGGDF